MVMSISSKITKFSLVPIFALVCVAQSHDVIAEDHSEGLTSSASISSKFEYEAIEGGQFKDSPGMDIDLKFDYDSKISFALGITTDGRVADLSSAAVSLQGDGLFSNLTFGFLGSIRETKMDSWYKGGQSPIIADELFRLEEINYFYGARLSLDIPVSDHFSDRWSASATFTVGRTKQESPPLYATDALQFAFDHGLSYGPALKKELTEIWEDEFNRQSVRVIDSYNEHSQRAQDIIEEFRDGNTTLSLTEVKQRVEEELERLPNSHGLPENISIGGRTINTRDIASALAVLGSLSGGVEDIPDNIDLDSLAIRIEELIAGTSEQDVKDALNRINQKVISKINSIDNQRVDDTLAKLVDVFTPFVPRLSEALSAEDFFAIVSASIEIEDMTPELYTAVFSILNEGYGNSSSLSSLAKFEINRTSDNMSFTLGAEGAQVKSGNRGSETETSLGVFAKADVDLRPNLSWNTIFEVSGYKNYRGIQNIDNGKAVVFSSIELNPAWLPKASLHYGVGVSLDVLFGKAVHHEFGGSYEIIKGNHLNVFAFASAGVSKFKDGIFESTRNSWQTGVSFSYTM